LARELKNMMERAVLLSPEGYFKLDLPNQSNASRPHPFEDNPSLDELQRRYILYVLEKTGNKIGGPGGAAELLGMIRTTLHSRMKKLGLR
jgi:DNA-binding NtrC family response regulator